MVINLEHPVNCYFRHEFHIVLYILTELLYKQHKKSFCKFFMKFSFNSLIAIQFNQLSEVSYVILVIFRSSH